MGPCIRVPHEQAVLVVEMLELRLIPHRVRKGGGICDAEGNVWIYCDRISFPGGDHRELQDLFVRWRPWEQ